MEKKCIVLFSGGLDSRLVLKIMQKKGWEIIALFFKLPFTKDNEKEIKEFVKKEKVKLKIFDCTNGSLLQEYLEIIKKAKHGTGTGINPCIDCRIFMLKEAKKFADKKRIEIICTGEVLGQRPMSQHKKGMELVGKESGLNDKLFRPLVEKGIEGRRRNKQIALAKKFKITYPSPAGGCLLCEKELKKRLKFLLERGLNEKEVKLIGIGRHFVIKKKWIVLGKNKEENKIIEKIKTGKIILPDFKAPNAVILETNSSTKPQPLITKQVIKKVNELIRAYSIYGSLEDRKSFERWKL
jgi:hypothetical protein